ncbi:MAG TPA: antibiotic biosynthesis monooxygenase [Solirubrobacteraceae bacterium]|jgi:quinol monooxygenase YgiN|nr:antibiotic biosynthesis monooxygenase [Solirubrobacteraceae bacterium]
MAYGVVHLPWYATGFRGDDLEAALAQLAPIALRYGAIRYDVYRSRDDRYKFLMAIEFESKDQWDAFYYGADFTEMRAATSSWYTVPLLYVWNDNISSGALRSADAVLVPDDGED